MGALLAVTNDDERAVWQLVSGSLAGRAGSDDGGLAHNALRNVVSSGRALTVLLATATLAADLLCEVHGGQAGEIARRALLDLAVEDE